MAELSFLARLVLTLLLSALSLFVYKWLHPRPPSPSQAPAKRSKKRSKKKSAKKSAVSDSPQPSPPPSQASTADTSAPAAAAIAQYDDVSESDSDDGLSAAQVLATRKFKPKSLGGTRLARKIKASLPSANAPRFAVDQQVLARFGGGDRWFPATVLEQRKGNEYHLKYDDGEVEYRVPAELIKLRPSDEDDKSDGNKYMQVSEEQQLVADAEEQEALSDSDLSGSDDDDGWQVVGTSSAAKRQARHLQTAAPAEPLVDGLTKRQRENRRKKERQKEKKELLRQHAQKDDLDARARWRYVPS
ncbi:hypothetical protein KRP22_001423 [Phytophthora ramorum]|uniref:Agenet domain-containing protein n=1 Tax=Phytophthora ramorum TaxID=164328 RepID=H3GCX1_PHYRM|nr:hypothetical protein KRP23_9875 [Phytophthora ramorum]KAH7504122.1 hypothetical protein KRP22_7168 [Phytophthora ramorum]